LAEEKASLRHLEALALFCDELQLFALQAIKHVIALGRKHAGHALHLVAPTSASTGREARGREVRATEAPQR